MVKLVQKYAMSDPRHSSLAKTKRVVTHISKKRSVIADICYTNFSYNLLFFTCAQNTLLLAMLELNHDLHEYQIFLYNKTGSRKYLQRLGGLQPG